MEEPLGRETGTGGGTDGGARGRAFDWLRPRLDDVPADLAEAVRACVRSADPADDAADPADGAGVPALLARGAVAELDRLIDRPADRDTAVRLLAADAALTYAFEAAAEFDADLPALADRIGLRGRIGRRLAELAGEDPQ